MDSERQPVPHEAAVAMLAEGEWVHTFRQATVPGMVLIGADWPRAKVIAWMLEHGVELAGPMASKMRHGLVGHDDTGPLFIETREGGS